jgi:hypothetical protein
VTDDGTAFVAARFESADAAAANSGRPEQSDWWAETEKCFDGPVSFVDCDDVETFRAGGSDDAGFVQVIRGEVNDIEAARAAFRPWLPLVNFEAQPGIGLAVRKEILHQRGLISDPAVRAPARPLPDNLRPLLRDHVKAAAALIQD